MRVSWMIPQQLAFVAALVLSQTRSALGVVVNKWTRALEDGTYWPRHECSFIQAGNKFYLFGGREKPTRMDRYDYATNKWDIVATVPVELNHVQAVNYQGLIWVIVGLSVGKYPSEVPVNNSYVYDPANDVWMQGPPVPVNRRRGAAGTVMYNDTFYVVGGSTKGHNGTVAYLDSFDPRTNTWTNLTDAPISRDHFAAVVVGDQLYNIGGRDTQYPDGVFNNTRAQIDVYDFLSSTWTTLPGVALTIPRAGTSAVYFEGKILVIGGESALQTNAHNETEAFDPVTQTIAQVARLNYGRHGTSAFVSGPGVIIAAGSPKQGQAAQKNMEYYSVYAPVGTPSTPGVMTGPVATPSIIEKDTVVTVTIAHTSGNTGIYVNSISFKGGVDRWKFQLASPVPSLPFLLGIGETRDIAVTYTGIKEVAPINMTVSYSGGMGTLVIPVVGINSNPQPTPAPTPYPCFPNNNAFLKSYVTDYIANGVDSLAYLTYGPISYWCVSAVTSFSQVFMSKPTFNEPLYWDTSKATTFAQMFDSALAFDQDLSYFNTSSATSLTKMFFNAQSFQGRGLSGWNVSKNADLSYTFKNAVSFNQDISGWDVRKVSNLVETFRNATSLNQNLCAWGTKMSSALLPPAKLVNAFTSSGCPINNVNITFTPPPAGPFCYSCSPPVRRLPSLNQDSYPTQHHRIILKRSTLFIV